MIKRAVASGVVAVVLGTLGPQAPSLPAVALDDVQLTASSGDSSCWNYKRSERTFRRFMNVARDVANVGKLSLDPEISKVARKHTREMINKETLHHTPTTTLTRRVTNWNVLGENVGVGGTATSLHQAFMNSPSHRENILYSSFRHVGIGVKKADGRMWVTVIFESRQDPGTTLKMPRC